jgi:MFS family permease
MTKYLQGLPLPRYFGTGLSVIMMAAGYYYNLTFIQLGMQDFGTRILGLEAVEVGRDMSILAISTCVIALSFGWWMKLRGWGKQFRKKLKISFWVVLAQAILTAVVILIQSEMGFVIWLVLVSLSLGVGVPAMFSLSVDLVPVRQRGITAAMVTALAYFSAEILSTQWTFDFFRVQLLILLAFGALMMAILAYLNHPWLDNLAQQHKLPEFGIGRFVRSQASGGTRPSQRMLGLILVMFGIYFIDSLGFLRLVDVPGFMEATWQSPFLADRFFIAGVHVIGALVAGILYQALNERQLIFWTLGLFALTHLMFSLNIRITGDAQVTLTMPMLYALAVSLYTVINFAVWADLSTPDTISFNSALGVALSGWTATFLSTGLAIYLFGIGLSLERHIQFVDALAMLMFITMLGFVFFRQQGPVE